MSYFTAFICENGHEISAAAYTCHDKYCTKCGSRVISKCPNCNTTIRGCYDSQFGFVGNYDVPAYCHSCGKPYPWTQAAIEAAVNMVKESDLTFEDQQKLISVLPDAVTETPRTQLASVRFKKAMSNVGSFIAEGLRDFAVSFGCEVFKNYLGLP